MIVVLATHFCDIAGYDFFFVEKWTLTRANMRVMFREASQNFWNIFEVICDHTMDGYKLEDFSKGKNTTLRKCVAKKSIIIFSMQK